MLEEPTSLRIDDPGVRALFTEAARFQSWLDVEAALALAQAELGIIPKPAAEEIARKAQLKYLDLDAIHAGLAKTGHPIVPVVWALDKACDGDGGAARHAADAGAGAHDRRSPGGIRDAARHARRDVQQDRPRDLHADEAGVWRGRRAGAGGHRRQQHDAAEAQPEAVAGYHRRG